MRVQAILAALVLGGLSAPAALAEPINANTRVVTMSCENGEKITVQYERPATSAALPNALRIVDSTTAFNFRSLTVVSPSGEILQDSPNGLHGAEQNQDLLTCSYVSPTSGNTLIVTGFFTPVGG